MTSKRIPVLFGTETGNSEYCADTIAEELDAAGFEAEAIDMSLYEPESIVHEDMVLIITSTYGNGDPPANATALLKYLQSAEVRLENTKFAVCALGDRSFAHFAQCGKDFDEALERLGASRMFDRVECDDDYDDGLEQYQEAVLAYLEANA